MSDSKFTSWEEIATLVGQFERGELAHGKWNHREHLTVAFWYLSRFDQDHATERIRSGILHLNESQGTPNTDTRGYHETLTLFWIRVIAKFLQEPDTGQSELERLNRLLDRYAGKSGLWREHYRFDLLRSVESRRTWVEPDISV